MPLQHLVSDSRAMRARAGTNSERTLDLGHKGYMSGFTL